MESLLQIRVSENMKKLLIKNVDTKGYKNISDYIRALIIADSEAEDVKQMLID